MTIRTIILGALLSIILGALICLLRSFCWYDNICIHELAVLSMGILSFFKNSNVKENNLVQTSASAGELLAAGIIFTIPAIVLIKTEATFIGWENFDYTKIFLYSIIGGIIIFFTIPLRKALIEKAKLLSRRSITAKVLQVGENSRFKNTIEAKHDLSLMISASLIGLCIKFLQSGIKIIPETFSKAFFGLKSIFAFGISLSPALVSVGFIIGRKISMMVFSGGVFAWFILIPIITAYNGFYDNSNLYDSAFNIWNTKIRYIGVGTMLVGGIWSLISVFKFLISGFKVNH